MYNYLHLDASFQNGVQYGRHADKGLVFYVCFFLQHMLTISFGLSFILHFSTFPHVFFVDIASTDLSMAVNGVVLVVISKLVWLHDMTMVEIVVKIMLPYLLL